MMSERKSYGIFCVFFTVASITKQKTIINFVELIGVLYGLFPLLEVDALFRILSLAIFC